MQKAALIFLSLIVASHCHCTSMPTISEPKVDQVVLQIPGTEIQISLADYIKMKPSDFTNLTGKKLNLKETIAFKITQKRIKKTIRKDGTIDMEAYQKASKEP